MNAGALTAIAPSYCAKGADCIVVETKEYRNVTRKRAPIARAIVFNIKRGVHFISPRKCIAAVYRVYDAVGAKGVENNFRTTQSLFPVRA